MQRVKARRSFEHGGSVKRGDILTGLTQQHADALSRKGLVVLLGADSGQEDAPATDPAGGAPAVPQGDPAGAVAGQAERLVFDPALLERNAPEVVAWIEQVGDVEQLQAALTAERAGKARKGVLSALEGALGG